MFRPVIPPKNSTCTFKYKQTQATAQLFLPSVIFKVIRFVLYRVLTKQTETNMWSDLTNRIYDKRNSRLLLVEKQVVSPLYFLILSFARLNEKFSGDTTIQTRSPFWWMHTASIELHLIFLLLSLITSLLCWREERSENEQRGYFPSMSGCSVDPVLFLLY